MNPPGDGWETLSAVALCETPHLNVYSERIATPSRPGGVEWVVARRVRAAVVAPRLVDGRYVLIRQERPAVRRVVWEFPAGQCDREGEAASETALRELGEEAGLVCRGGLTPLGEFHPAIGFADEVCALFLAEECEFVEGLGQQDPQEAILDVRAVAPDALEALIAAGEIVDSNTLAAYARLQARGLFTP